MLALAGSEEELVERAWRLAPGGMWFSVAFHDPGKAGCSADVVRETPTTRIHALDLNPATAAAANSVITWHRESFFAAMMGPAEL